MLELLAVHPAMKAVVARETAALVLKPVPSVSQANEANGHIRFGSDKVTTVSRGKTAITDHARYYGLITLNQITLVIKDRDLAGLMVELYFEIFREILGDGLKQVSNDDLGEVEHVDQEKVSGIAGKVDKWRGRRKGAKPKNGKQTALESEELMDTGESRLVAAVLTGINRALPFAKIDEGA